MKNPIGLFSQITIPILTQHQKEKVIGPVLTAALGCKVVRVKGFDTDSVTPTIMWNREVVVWVDAQRQWEIFGESIAVAQFKSQLIQNWEALRIFAKVAGFPSHRLVLRPEQSSDPRFRKGLGKWSGLKAAYEWAQANSKNGFVFVETDVRAHCNPTRMENIRLATLNLVEKLKSTSPQCTAPGFCITNQILGLPCETCEMPTRILRAYEYRCIKCGYQITREKPYLKRANSLNCDYCNP